MLIQNIVKDEQKLADLQVGLNYLNGVGMYPALLEHSIIRTTALNGNQMPTIETRAMKDSFRDGYVAALVDVFDFFSEHVKDKNTALRPTYGAEQALIDSGEFTKEELDAARNSE